MSSFSRLVARLAMATVEGSSRSSELDRCIRALPKRRIGELDEVNEPRKESSVVTPTAPAPPVAQPRTTSEIVEQILADATPDVQASLSYRLAKQYFDSAQPASVVPPVTLPTKAAKLVEGIPVVPVEAASEEVSFPLFGEAGVKVTETLGALSLFAAGGLFGGIGTAATRLSLSVPPTKGPYDEGDEDEDGDFGRGDRPFESADSQEGGSNKKKRKIPGAKLDQDEEEVGGVVDARAPRVGSDAKIGVKRGESLCCPCACSSADAECHIAPVDLPRTAKAALAKLHSRPPHISNCLDTLSSRRHYFKLARPLQSPLALPLLVPWTPPLSYLSGPPALPPGSGLKGSKGIKAAMKAASSREKENQRMKAALGGGTIKLPDFYNPLGPALLVASVNRLQGVKFKSGYLTPPASSDEGDSAAANSPPRHEPRSSLPAVVPTLARFQFESAASPVVEFRWLQLKHQIKRLQALTERAVKAREEENQRREDEEKEMEQELIALGKKAAVVPKTTAKKPAAASHVAVDHSTSEGSPSSNSPRSFQTPLSPVAPLPPLRRPPPPKKGRKKRIALANGQNPHHRDNYVPARKPSPASPHTTSQPLTDHGSTAASPLMSWPASDQAIAAVGGQHSSFDSQFATSDEFLCVWCDYELFYGEDHAFTKAMLKRQKLLKVRRKAKARAAKAANGIMDNLPPLVPIASSSTA